jgi:hypothetical protein
MTIDPDATPTPMAKGRLHCLPPRRLACGLGLGEPRQERRRARRHREDRSTIRNAARAFRKCGAT